MALRKRGKTWTAQVNFKDEDGKVRYASKGGFKTKKEAQIYEDQLKAKKDKGKLTSEKPEFRAYFWDWANLYRLPGKAPNTVKRYKYVKMIIEQYFGYLKLNQITRAKYQNFLNKYGKEHAKNTVTKTTKIIKSCLKDAYADGLIMQDPTFKARLTWDDDKTRKPDYLSVSELKALVDQLKGNLNPAYTSRYVILAGIATGARIGELLALRWSDIDYTKETISITRSYDYVHKKFKKPKTKNSIRIIKVSRDFLNTLDQLKENKQKLIFARPTGDTPSTNAVNHALRYNMSKIGLSKRDFHFHSLRHCHVAYLYSAGVDWYRISERLGHSSVAFTMSVYSYLIDESKKKADDQITGALNKIDL